MAWGLYDTKDNVWLGDRKGPKLFAAGEALPNGSVLNDETARIFARAAAEAAAYSVGWEPTRVVVREFDLKSWRKRDSVKKIKGRTTLDWLKRKERGAIP